MAAPSPLGAYELLRQALQQQALQQPGNNLGPPANTSTSYPSGGGIPRGGLLGRLLAFQAAQGSQPPSVQNNEPVPSEPRDPNFRQLARVSPVNGGEAPVEIPNSDSGSPATPQPVQFLPFLDLPLDTPFFAKPPMWVPEQLRPLAEVPKGSANGERAGMPFRRGPPPDIYPECTYCMEQTGPGDYQEDHVIPKSRGGDGSDENKAPTCRHCNLQKRALTPEEYYKWIEEHT